MSEWTGPGATLSLKNACKEFGFTEQEIEAGMRAGELQFHINYAHGNPYYLLIRKEVEAFAKARRGSVRMARQKLQAEFDQLTTELRSLKRRQNAVEKRRAELAEKLGVK